jgi:REP element-mobilizing transposase RayT
MNDFRSRKPNRLKGFDYSDNGAYFVTICTKNREELFGTIAGAEFRRPQAEILTKLSECGLTVKNEIDVLSSKYPEIFVDKYVVMPNHVHMIIVVSGGGRQNAAPTISRVINQWKRAISIKTDFSPWQKSFHDHIIRNGADYDRIARYIENNPSNWEKDCFYC